MFQKFKCPVKECDYECGFHLEDNEDGELRFARRIEFSKTLRDEHPNHALPRTPL